MLFAGIPLVKNTLLATNDFARLHFFDKTTFLLHSQLYSQRIDGIPKTPIIKSLTKRGAQYPPYPTKPPHFDFGTLR